MSVTSAASSSSVTGGSKLMSLAVFKSMKENERRVPLHPETLISMPPHIGKQIWLENEYGKDFGYSDEQLKKYVAGFLPRAELYKKTEAVLIAKPTLEDFSQVSDGAVTLGWSHFTQGKDVTQVAVDKKLTCITFEAMHRWSEGTPRWMRHVFYKNNQVAGYAAVQHSLNLLGVDGVFGRRQKPKKACVIGRGNVAVGSVWALHARGFNDIVIASHQSPELKDHFAECVRMGDPEIGLPADSVYDSKRAHYVQVYEDQDPNTGENVIKCTATKNLLMDDVLKDCDIIVVALIQNPLNPVMMAPMNRYGELKNRALVVDVSCDEGMAFKFCKPTSFENPMFKVGIPTASEPEKYVSCYGVDHTPSFCFDAASYDISSALMEYLEQFLGQKERNSKWAETPTLGKALEVHEGVIQFEEILKFQNREKEYPHKFKQ